MAQIQWDIVGNRHYEVGVDHGVLYIDGQGVPWNGLKTVTELTSGGEARSYYLDGYKRQLRRTREEHRGSIEAYTYPKQFEQCDGYESPWPGLSGLQQKRKSFDFCYRTMVGDDIEDQDAGYALHLIYNATVAPADKVHESLSDSVDPSVFAWEYDTVPMLETGFTRPVSHVVVSSLTTNSILLSQLEGVLYGTSFSMPRMPSPSEILTLFQTGFPFTVVNNEDGTSTISGSEPLVVYIDEDTVRITTDTVVDNGDDTFTISS